MSDAVQLKYINISSLRELQIDHQHIQCHTARL
jgi:hypothetical protein